MSDSIVDALHRALEPSVGPATARTVVTSALNRLGLREQELTREQLGAPLTAEIERSLRLVRSPDAEVAQCVNRLVIFYRSNRGDNSTTGVSRSAISIPQLDKPHVFEVHLESDIVKAQNEIRELARRLGFSMVDQIKITTVVSALARNMVNYAGSGTLTSRTVRIPRVGIEILASDRGPGIKHLDQILGGTYVSKTGMGQGLTGSRSVMDEFSVSTGDHGTRVLARKYLAR